MEQRRKEECVKVAICCALEVCKNRDFAAWAQAWLSGQDRSEATAREVAVLWQEVEVACCAVSAAIACVGPAWQEESVELWMHETLVAASEIVDIDMIAIVTKAVNI